MYLCRVVSSGVRLCHTHTLSLFLMHLSSSPPTFLPPHPFFLPPNFLTHVVVSMRGWRLAVLDGKKSRIRIENVCWFKSASLCCPMPLNRAPHCATKELPQLPHLAPCFSLFRGREQKIPGRKISLHPCHNASNAYHTVTRSGLRFPCSFHHVVLCNLFFLALFSSLVLLAARPALGFASPAWWRGFIFQFFTEEIRYVLGGPVCSVAVARGCTTETQPSSDRVALLRSLSLPCLHQICVCCRPRPGRHGGCARG